MSYTVKQLAELADVTVRTLHYYDEIGLLTPGRQRENDYRVYDDDDLLRLQQILFYREFELQLSTIQRIIDSPDFDALQALQAHRAALKLKARRLQTLIANIDRTIRYLKGEEPMSKKKKLFEGFSKEEESAHAEAARQRWDADEVDASYQRWNSYSSQKQEQVLAEGREIYAALGARTDQDPASDEVQTLIARWHDHMRYFYEPSIARLRGLGQLYVDSPDFAQNIGEVHPDLPQFMQQAINIYCDRLES